MEWMQILFFVGAALLLWMVYRTYKAQPGQFSKENIGKSLNTLGILALALILFIWLLVLMLKQ